MQSKALAARDLVEEALHRKDDRWSLLTHLGVVLMILTLEEAADMIKVMAGQEEA
jgi:hypothetical protein